MGVVYNTHGRVRARARVVNVYTFRGGATNFVRAISKMSDPRLGLRSNVVIHIRLRRVIIIG